MNRKINVISEKSTKTIEDTPLKCRQKPEPPKSCRNHRSEAYRMHTVHQVYHAVLSVSRAKLATARCPAALPALPSNTKGPALLVGVNGPSDVNNSVAS